MACFCGQLRSTARPFQRATGIALFELIAGRVKLDVVALVTSAEDIALFGLTAGSGCDVTWEGSSTISILLILIPSVDIFPVSFKVEPFGYFPRSSLLTHKPFEVEKNI
jgi:hypothetical protein